MLQKMSRTAIALLILSAFTYPAFSMDIPKVNCDQLRDGIVKGGDELGKYIVQYGSDNDNATIAKSAMIANIYTFNIKNTLMYLIADCDHKSLYDALIQHQIDAFKALEDATKKDTK